MMGRMIFFDDDDTPRNAPGIMVLDDQCNRHDVPFLGLEVFQPAGVLSPTMPSLGEDW